MGNSAALTPLERKLRHLLDRRRANSTLRTLTINNTNQADFSSNDFLSLSTSQALKAAFLCELQKKDLPIGSGGSRLLDGNSAYAESLEKTIAEFHGAETGLLFNSGFDANAGFFACVPQPGDVVLYDELIHASVHDGMRLSRAAKCLPFGHNCSLDLRRLLEALLEEEELGKRLREGTANVFVAVEAVYSMDGDVAPLLSLVETVEAVLPKGGGHIVVDEAHATGVLGPQGRGLVCLLGLEERVFARLHTFGKALACNGAVILGSPTLRTYLLNYARPLIYTTFLSYPALAAIHTSYNFLQQGHTTSLAHHLNSLIQTLFTALTTSTATFKAVLKVPSVCPRSPIFSIQLEEPKGLAGFLQKRGIMVRAVVPPTVPEGTSRVRVCLHAGNTVEEVTRLVSAMEEWCVNRSRGPASVGTAEQLKGDGVVYARL